MKAVGSWLGIFFLIHVFYHGKKSPFVVPTWKSAWFPMIKPLTTPSSPQHLLFSPWLGGNTPNLENYLPKSNCLPLKIGHPKWKRSVFQPSIFRGELLVKLYIQNSSRHVKHNRVRHQWISSDVTGPHHLIDGWWIFFGNICSTWPQHFMESWGCFVFPEINQIRIWYLLILVFVIGQVSFVQSEQGSLGLQVSGFQEWKDLAVLT